MGGTVENMRSTKAHFYAEIRLFCCCCCCLFVCLFVCFSSLFLSKAIILLRRSSFGVARSKCGADQESRIR